MHNRLLFTVLAVLLCFWSVTLGEDGDIGYPEEKGTVLRGSAYKFDAIRIWTAKGLGKRIVYGDDRGFLHVLEQKEQGFSEVWESISLGAVKKVFVEDLDLDGRPEIVACTAGGSIYVFDSETYRLVWREGFGTLGSIEIEDVDADPQKELIFCAGGSLYIYDWKNRLREWEDPRLSGTDLVVGNVDDDESLEIVLNTGFVLDVQYRHIEWELPGGFGEKVGLLDLDVDGILEVIGESSGGYLKVFDVDLRREKF